MKRKRKWVIAGIVAAAAVMVLVLSKLPKHVTVKETIDFTQLLDGHYQGSYDNGLVAAEVETTVEDGKVTAIQLVKHQNGFGEPAEALIDRVLEQQSLSVDIVSGATFSSETILKAIELALGGAK